MNHIYKSIWNASLGTWIAVSELAKGKSRNSTKISADSSEVKSAIKIAPTLLATGLLAFSASTWALPTGNELVAGQATVSNPAANQMQINQASNRAVINWQGFSVGQNEAVNIQQPNAQAALLNRVVGQDASQIQGKIQANGQVYLVNPNGVLFGKTAQVDVGGLVASTHDINNADFMNGKNHFTQNGATGKVENHGIINTSDGGVVALIGEQVTNTGTINTPKGTTALAAGKTVDLDFQGDGLVEVKVTEAAFNAQIKNQGTIQADGGSVVMSAKAANSLIDTVIDQQGIVKAQGLIERNGKIRLDGGDNGAVKVSGTLDVQGTQGGKVNVAGKNIELSNTAVVNASGTQQGGTVLIGDKLNTNQVTLAQGSTIQADVTENGTAGKVEVFANMDKGQVNVQGAIHAKALKKGNGGFIETSAAKVQIADSVDISTKAEQGQSGTWLIDPTDFNIGGINSNQSGATLSTQLGKANIIIRSTSGTTGVNGDVNVYDTVNWAANTLTLNAQRNININANLNGSGTAKLILDYGQASATGGVDDNYFFNNGASVNLSAGQNFFTKKGSAGALQFYTVITDLGTLADATLAPAIMTLQGINKGVTGKYVLGANIDASATSTAAWGSTGFMPLGNFDILNSTPFTGIFDGLGHTISGLTINRPTTDFVGLFGALRDASVRNIGMLGGSVAGRSNVGGLVGNSSSSSINNAYATGSVSGTTSYVGGLAGHNVNNSTITNSYATGSVSGTASFVGGLVGENSLSSTITNSYATGSVSGNSSVGGLVGINSGSSINNAYATGSVSGNSSVGGLVGENTNASSINASFWDTQTTGQANGVGSGVSSGVTGKTTAEMQTLSTFTNAGWNIDNQGGTGTVWRIYEGYTSPLLRSFLAPLTITADNTSTTYNGLAYNGGLVNASYNPATVDIAHLFNTGTPYLNAINAGTYTPSSQYSDQLGYDISYVNSVLTINKAPLTITANDIIKLYGLSYLFDGTEFNVFGLVNGETIKHVDLSSAGADAAATVSGSPYKILASNAKGGSFNPKNYDISFNTGKLTVLPITINGIPGSTTTINNITQIVNNNNFAISGPLGNVVQIGGNTFVRIGNRDNFSSANNSNASLSSSQLTSLQRIYQVLGFYVSQALIPFSSPLQTSTSENMLSYDTPSARADDILKRFEEVDSDFGQYKHSIYQTKKLDYDRYKELGKLRWSEKKYRQNELQKHYDSLFFNLDGAGINLPDGVTSSSIDSSTDSTGSHI